MTLQLQPGVVATSGNQLAGVVDLRSVGVSRYARLLARALTRHGLEYRLAERRDPGHPAHVHLANSSRSLLRQSRRPGAPFVVTVHDVLPRTRALRPLYHALAYPQVTRLAAAAVVHSTYAADLLVATAGAPRRLEVIPHPARRPASTDRSAARRALGWPEDRLIAVLPGVVKRVKLVTEAVVAGQQEPGWQVALAGRIGDVRLAREARAHGALVLPDPSEPAYEQAIVAADCVLCLRSGSVGETNGPLLDALGAGRAVIATATGSIPEVAGAAALYCDGTVASIRAALAALSDPADRSHAQSNAAARGAGLTWRSSAALHAQLFSEALGG